MGYLPPWFLQAVGMLAESFQALVTLQAHATGRGWPVPAALCQQAVLDVVRPCLGTCFCMPIVPLWLRMGWHLGPGRVMALIVIVICM